MEGRAETTISNGSFMGRLCADSIPGGSHTLACRTIAHCSGHDQMGGGGWRQTLLSARRQVHLAIAKLLLEHGNGFRGAARHALRRRHLAIQATAPDVFI